MRARVPTPFVPCAGLLLAACASLGAPYGVHGTIPIQPGGRVEGRVTVPANSDVRLRLENEGPGRADFAVRTAEGQALLSGALDEATSHLESTEPVDLVIVVEAYADAATTVEYSFRGPGAVSIHWDLSRAGGRTR